MKLEPFRLERYFAVHEFSASFLLCTSDCESMELGELLSLEPDAAERFQSLWAGVYRIRRRSRVKGGCGRIVRNNHRRSCTYARRGRRSDL